MAHRQSYKTSPRSGHELIQEHVHGPLRHALLVRGRERNGAPRRVLRPVATLYDVEHGWHDVEVHPDGTFTLEIRCCGRVLRRSEGASFDYLRSKAQRQFHECPVCGDVVSWLDEGPGKPLEPLRQTREQHLERAAARMSRVRRRDPNG